MSLPPTASGAIAGACPWSMPRALVNRDTRGFIKIVADTDTGRIAGITPVAKDAGDLAAASVSILEARLHMKYGPGAHGW